MNGNLPEFKKDYTVDIPKYVEPGELWVLRMADGTVTVISSDLSPIHFDWPGRVKGYPVPSAEYRADRRALARREAQRNLEISQRALNEVLKNPVTYAQERWSTWQESRRKEVTQFQGPSDPALHNFLIRDWKSNVEYYKNELEKLSAGY